MTEFFCEACGGHVRPAANDNRQDGQARRCLFCGEAAEHAAEVLRLVAEIIGGPDGARA